MITPNTLCMIRGIPKTHTGYTCNGKVVQAVKIKAVVQEGNIWEINPALHENNNTYHGCAERWLHPLDPCEDDLAREALDEVLERTFRETLERELEKV